MNRASRALVILAYATTLPIARPGPATAQAPAKRVAYGHKSFHHACRPPLKFAAGACVHRCPAGYQDNGRYCRFRSKHN